MPVPDDVIFSPSDGPLPTYYGQVRKMDDDQRIAALKRRLADWLVGQIDELGKEEGGECKVYAPFPLAVLTCVAMETLGTVMYYSESETTDDNPRVGFRKIAKRMNERFARQLPKPMKRALKTSWGDVREVERVQTIADLLYIYFRNTLIHRYQGLGVQLTEEVTSTYKCTERGTISLNPYWFWRRFKAVFHDMFDELASNLEPTNPLRQSALRYVQRLLA